MTIDKTKLESTEEDFFGFNDSPQLRSQKVYGESHVKLDGTMETPKEHRVSSGEDKEKKKAAKEFYDYILWLHDYISDLQTNILASTKALKAIDMLRELYKKGNLDANNKSHQQLLEDAGLTYDEVMTGGDRVFDKKEKFWNDRLEQNVKAYNEAQNLQQEFDTLNSTYNLDFEERLETYKNSREGTFTDDVAVNMYLAKVENIQKDLAEQVEISQKDVSLIASAGDFEGFFSGISVVGEIDKEPIFENAPPLSEQFAAASNNSVTIQNAEPKITVQPPLLKGGISHN
ncbi:hypothetical protein NBRC110019_32150 [Neptunitalea chrysea]|uniref:Uncharacterized protein n=2 Tax=Neptunitalea chrysea TaxID=1647581 RepID=A0A9W6B7F9_9FLAO|nr:hypothetical protein NBRC110019_32150 [Neptunitalea chrysea]